MAPPSPGTPGSPGPRSRRAQARPRLRLRPVGLLLAAAAAVAVWSAWRARRLTLARAPGPGSGGEGAGAGRECFDRLLRSGRMLRCKRIAGAGEDWCWARHRLYERIAVSTLAAGRLQSIQSHDAGELFTTNGPEGRPVPVLHALDVPVRAVVLKAAQGTQVAAVKDAVRAALDGAADPGRVWWQDERMFHSTLVHAVGTCGRGGGGRRTDQEEKSTHTDPVPSTPTEISYEKEAVRDEAGFLCAVVATLERVFLTASGTVIAGWQIETGTEVADMRQRLRRILPNSPEKQTVTSPEIFHTTVARLVEPPERPEAVARALEAATRGLCGHTVAFGNLAYVVERDLLALALRGDYAATEFPLKACPLRRRAL